MKINIDIVNVLPKLLRRLSNGESLNICSLSKELDIPQSTIKDNFNKYLVPIDIAEIEYSHSTKSWTAKKNFLSETLLTADELITIKILEVTSKSYGDLFSKATQRLFNRFEKRASLSIFKKTKMEKFTKSDDIKLAIIKNAIKSKKVLVCSYSKKERVVYPLKIVLLEGFWYLFHWDTASNFIKKFHLKSIESVSINGDTFKQVSSNLIEKLDGAINAYFKDAEPIFVQLLVHSHIVKYFQRQPLSKYQYITKAFEENYYQMDITITDEMEIIPTIQQYLPYIKVLSPSSLDQKIRDNIANYTQTNLVI